MSVSNVVRKFPQSRSSESSFQPAAQPAVRTAAPQRAATPATGFERTSAFTASAAAPVALSGGAQQVGPLALDSAPAQAAIQKALAFIGQQAGGSSGPRLLSASAQAVDMSKDFTPRSVERDELGMTHVRMDRRHEGVRVFGEQVIGHLDRKGEMRDLTGAVATIPAGLGKDPVKLSAKDALAIAGKEFNGQTDRSRPPSAERVVFQDKSGQYRAAYHVQMDNVTDLKADQRPRRMNYLVDANTGELLTQYNQLGGIELPHDDHGHPKAAARGPQGSPRPPTATATPTPAPGQGDDTSLYSGKVDLSTTRNADGTYRLEDSTRGKGVATYDGRNQQRPSGKTQITDNNNTWGEARDPARARAGVDAHYGAQMTYDFMKNVLGRDSIDGKGEKLVSYVHVDRNYVNAFWDGEKMNYGDGDGRTSGPLTTLDIAGHEIAHGLTERTAGLIYEGESGGLNEAMSDIVGTGVEWYASQKNASVKFDWTVGEDAWTPTNGDNTDGLRYMNDPTKDGYSIDNYKDYPRQTEVHGSSGIANNAFYLLVNGGKNRTSGLEVKDGIGMDKGQKIFHRALTTYMTPRTTFAQAREATLKAATDLYGASSAEVQKVRDSWTAVGVR